MITTHSLTFGYSHSTSIFQDFNWQVQRGETWAILGSSGCGKTTLLYLLAGLRFPTEGTIEIDGGRLTRPRPRSGLILQDYGLLPWSTVRENAELGLPVRDFYGEDGKHTPKDFQPENSVEHWLDRLGLNEVADKFPSQISGGQRQRAAHHHARSRGRQSPGPDGKQPDLKGVHCTIFLSRHGDSYNRNDVKRSITCVYNTPSGHT